MNVLLTKQQCNAARALAIAGIMLHNYCHAFDFAIKESEFNFAIEETTRWGDYLQHIDGNLLINIFSWAGHYTMPAFIFLGGYGLVRKYEAEGASFAVGSFIFKQYKKLLALMLVPLLAFIVLQLVALRHTFVTPWGFVAQLGMVINIIPGMKIVPNPYWYLGMMMQLYVIYALIHRFQSPKARLCIPLALMALGYALHLAVPEDSEAATWLRFNAPAALIPFGMGLLAGRYGKATWITTLRAAILLPVLAVLIVAFSFNYALWGLNYGLGAAAVICLASLLRGRLLAWTAQIGTVSALLYILHPVTRFAVMLPSMHLIPDYPHLQVAIFLITTAITVCLYRKLKIDEKVNKIIMGR